MNAGRKWQPKAQALQQKPSQHLTRSPKPGIVQPKVAAPQVKKTPAAPPVYRPQSTPKVLQKKSDVSRLVQAKPVPRTPVAPPVYRPQPTPKVLQTKPAQSPRPSLMKKVAQPKTIVSAQSRPTPKAPPVYRPQPKALSQPRPHATALQLKAQGAKSLAPSRGTDSSNSRRVAAKPGPRPPSRGVIQGLILKLDDLATKRLRTAMLGQQVTGTPGPAAVRAIQDMRAVDTGAEGLRAKPSRGQVTTDQSNRAPLNALERQEKLFIIGHGGLDQDDEDHLGRLLRIRRYGGYTARGLAEQLIRLGLPRGYDGQIYLTGCGPAATKDGSSFLDEFQTELRELGVGCAVKGAVDSTTPDPSGRIKVKKQFDDSGQINCKMLEYEIEEMLELVGRYRKGELKENERTPALNRLYAKADQIDKLMDQEITSDLVFKNTKLQGKIQALTRSISEQLLQVTQEKYNAMKVQYQSEYFTTDKDRKRLLPGQPVQEAKIDTERLNRLRVEAHDSIMAGIREDLVELENILKDVFENISPLLTPQQPNNNNQGI